MAAVAAQPLVMAARMAPDFLRSNQPLYGIDLMFLSVVVVAAAAVLVLGLPAFLLLRRFGRDSWLSMATTGFILGALPIAATSWPRHLDGYSSGENWHGKYIDLYLNGVPTDYAWITYAESVVYFGLHGLVGSIVFYAVWRKMGRQKDLFEVSQGK